MNKYKKNLDYQILTPKGWCDFKGVSEFDTNEFIKITLDNSQKILCTCNHKFILLDGKTIYAKDLINGTQLNKDVHVKKVEFINQKKVKRFFDINEVNNENKFYYSGDKASIINHNCGGNCVDANTQIIIRDKKTGQIKNIKIEEAYNNFQLNESYEILTPTGWSDFYGIKQIQSQEGLILFFNNNQKLICTHEHKVKIINQGFIEAKYLKIGDEVQTKNEFVKIIDIQKDNFKRNYYDVLNVQFDNQYYTNEIVSHNCIMLSTPRGCVTGDTHTHVRNKKTGQIKKIKIQDCKDELLQNNSINIENNDIFFYINNNIYQVLTPQGWKDFSSIRIAQKEDLYYIQTNKNCLNCTSDHLLKMENGQFKQVKQIVINQKLFDEQIIIKIYPLQGEKTLVYDFVNVQGSQYYTNNIISHNCGNTFYRLWTQAEEGGNKFHTIKLPWYIHPQRDQTWRDQQTKALTAKLAKRQCDCEFESSGDNAISSEILIELQNSFIQQPIQKLENQALWIFRYPEPQKQYIISADVARGDDSDFSAFHVISIQDDQQVAEYKAKISTTMYGQLLVKIARFYNDAFLVVQNANIGWAVLQQIVNQDYKNVYYHKKDYKYIDAQLHSRVKPNKKQDAKKDIIGFTTSPRTRPLIIQKLNVVLQNKQFIIHSKRTINELRTFIWINGKAQAMQGCNDDLVLSLAIGIWVRNISYVIKKQANAFVRKKLSNFNSGLNIKHGQQNKISTGFFNGNNNYSKVKDNIFDIGGQQVDLVKFYFPSITKK